ncbi:hypothetical protein GTE46_003215 [Salmonella enterica subsp. enterica]|uniref:Uncharacterized protein n=2 Tax=Salmonella enterica TaxID=28901 RepID=A0A5U3D3K4_SALDZ|nr:hypothetical protein [Salmonella enterica]EBP3413787.1 hypothetical protein [Salmonella enterica subsp. diarizonae]EBP3907008.1 hypothetical protein [Salmonella enterica subsp. enterica]EBW8698930.1 hypothetical protein [Salmonella enterica subsp. diarizonae serovar 16:z10:e,n,x,z15]ECD6628632.1 hypothetical protein [Salmonella enterica subsp. enterica serovar Rubislaw]ECG1719430.1 hypothetical protein [Salmonella enterica subsp. diarizonae serovar 17:z10:e,n,x,z15]EEJ0271499.1 hypothetica
MKLTIEDVQVAIKGVTKYGNRCISEQLLAVVAGNYAKGNNIILLRLQSLYEDEYSDSTIGEIKNLYYTEKTGKAQLRGDLIFDTEKLDIQSILHSLAHGCVYLSPYFMNVMSLDYGFACLSQVTLSKAEYTDFDGIEPLDISCLDGLINALYKEEPATEAPAEPQEGNSPYIHAPGMSREDVLAWIKDVYNNALSSSRDEKELQELKDRSSAVERLLDDREKFLSEAIRT